MPAAADTSFADRFDVHGFGYQDYARTSANTYLGADTHGTWDNNFLGLIVAATLTDESKLWAQLETSSTGGTGFTWFFVDYQATESVRLHGGRVKLPLGFYNEIIDVKSLQPAALEPALYQEGADFVHDAYNGVGVDYTQDLGGGHLLWQAWAGDLYDAGGDVSAATVDRNAYGGRLTYRTPIEGLNLMVSAYRNQVQTIATSVLTNENRGIASVEYVSDSWDLKSEYGLHKINGVSSYAYYGQAAYRLTPRWQPYVRYDFVVTDKSQRTDPSFQQKIAVAGLGFKVNDSIGLKLEDHFNRGYALPVASGEVAAGAGARTWNLFIAQADFSF